MIYIITFLLSIFAAYLAIYYDKRQNKILSTFFSIISILLPSILAGLRSEKIGTDIGTYLKADFIAAGIAKSFKNYVSLIWGRNSEYIYLLIVYFTHKIFGNIQWLLFFLQFFTLTCFYIGGFRLRKEYSLPLLLILYYLMFYNSSLNILRQALAMAVLFCGLKDLFDKKYFKYSVYIIIATLIHNTSIIAFSFIFLHIIFNKKENINNSRRQVFFELFIILILVSFVFGIQYFVSLLTRLGIISSRYLYYVNNGSLSGQNFETLIYLIEIFWILSTQKIDAKKIANFEYLKINSFTNIILLQLSRFMYYGQRISLFYSIVNLLLFAGLPKAFSTKGQRIFIGICFAILFFIYWVYVVVVGGAS